MVDIKECAQCKYCKNWTETSCFCGKLRKKVTVNQRQTKCPLVPKDYYAELKIKLSRWKYGRWEELAAISDKICWCWKFRKITEAQLEELSKAVCDRYDGDY